MTDKEFYKELKATGIIFLFVGLIFFLVYIGKKIPLDKTFYISIFSYFAILIFLGGLNLFFKNKYLKRINGLIYLPLALVGAVLIIIIPFWLLLLHLIFYFMFAFLIPELLYKVLNYLHLIDFIQEPTALYLRITLTVFICVLFNPSLRNLVYLLSPARIKTSEKLRPYQLDKLTNYLLSSDNIRLIVYVGYVVALGVINYSNFQNSSISKTMNIDRAILQSFVTFIAFDRALVLFKQLNFKPSRLLTRIYKAILNKTNKNSN